MAHKLYECNSCGYVIFIADAQREPDWCPACRSRMSHAGEEHDPPGLDYTCDECAYAFRTPQGADPPYKCASCNRTIPNEPNKRVNRKL